MSFLLIIRTGCIYAFSRMDRPSPMNWKIHGCECILWPDASMVHHTWGCDRNCSSYHCSQAMISGAFTLISEAMRLNLWPKVRSGSIGRTGAVYSYPQISALMFLGCAEWFFISANRAGWRLHMDLPSFSPCCQHDPLCELPRFATCEIRMVYDIPDNICGYWDRLPGGFVNEIYAWWLYHFDHRCSDVPCDVYLVPRPKDQNR